MDSYRIQLGGVNMYYAQLQNNKVVCLSNLSGEVIADNMIKLQGDYSQLMGNKYENGAFKTITLNNQKTTINTAINIPITYEKFVTDSYITDTTINKTIEVYLNNVLQTTTEIINGNGNIEFESAEAGTFVIKVENATCEVVVNG
jgi:hypothetical protein